MRLTDISVRALSFGEPQKTYTDDTLPGFGVRVSKTTKTFVVVYAMPSRNTGHANAASITFTERWSARSTISSIHRTACPTGTEQ